jgi:hypothetical protein
MKSRNFFIIALLGLISFSCKNEDSKKKEIEAKKVDPKELFKVSLDLIISKDDSLQIFYREAGMEDYDGSKTVFAAVKGSNLTQQVEFVLPENVLPSKLRIDLGNNKEQLPVEIKNFTMKYMDKIFQAKDTMFFQYFIPNDQIEWDRKKAVAKIKAKPNTFYDPGFLSRDVMDEELIKITQ